MSMDSDEIAFDAEERMEGALEHLAHEFNTIRTGRATRGLVENIRVEYYGEHTPIGQAANISLPSPRLIVIKPYDASQLGEFEKAIQKSALGINPSNDGKVLRLEVPALTEERRTQLVRQVKEVAEQAKVSINNVRRDANKHADTAQKDKSAAMTEDDAKRVKEEIDKLKDRFQKQVDEYFEKKSTEILAI